MTNKFQIFKATAEAKSNRCTFIKLNTFSFQAPEFYKKLGYKEMVMIENAPLGSNHYYFKKDLKRNPDGHIEPMKTEKTKIIAIAAVSGGGKTTVTSRLNQVLNNSSALYFDDYDLDGPDNIMDWVERGANCNEWNLDPLISDLRRHATSENIEYILLDYPFARLHDQLRNIDLAIFIDTPLDIAMARRLRRDFMNKDTEAIMDDLSNYLSQGRIGYESMLETTMPNSDLTISGSLSVDEIVDRICEEIRNL